MKIVKSTDFSGWRYEFECEKCESVLEAEPSDVIGMFHEAWSDQRDNSGAPAYWTYKVICPICKEDNGGFESKMPTRLKIDVQERSKRR
jgi:hypothetical protein